MSSIQTAPEQFEVLKQSTTLVAPAGVGVAATEPEYQFDAQRTIGSLAQSLASVHQVVIEEDSLLWESQLCVTALDLVERALRSVALPPEALGELSPAYRHMSRERLSQILQDGAASMDRDSSEFVLLQGNPRLGNLRFVGQTLLGFEDWSESAVGDPYFDLAVAARDLLRIFGPQPIQAFFGEYGLLHPDPVRLDWYLLAVELCCGE